MRHCTVLSSRSPPRQRVTVVVNGVDGEVPREPQTGSLKRQRSFWHEEKLARQSHIRQRSFLFDRMCRPGPRRRPDEPPRRSTRPCRPGAFMSQLADCDTRITTDRRARAAGGAPHSGNEEEKPCGTSVLEASGRVAAPDGCWLSAWLPSFSRGTTSSPMGRRCRQFWLIRAGGWGPRTPG